MCLETVYTTKPAKTGKGYKAFRVMFRGELYSLVQGNRNKRLPLGKWLNEVDYRKKYVPGTPITLKSRDGTPYSHGFHILNNKVAAKRWGRHVYRVQYRKAHTIGKQACSRAIVASEIKIIRKAQ